MIRFDLVGGFLGAGKTTLVKKILQGCAARREKVAVIENEFGEVSIDTEILKAEGFDIFELSQGCVCCTLKKDFAHTLKKIISQKPDRIVFEPSGIFMINEIFDLFHDPEVLEKCCLNSVTTVVDGENFIKHRDMFPGFFASQIRHASTVFVSKSQLIRPDDLAAIRSEILKSNSALAVITKDWQDLSDRDLMLALDGNVTYAFSSDARNTDSGTEMESAHHLIHGFESLGLRTSRIFQEKELDRILLQFPKPENGQVLRGKGILQAADRFLEFSYVDGRYSISPAAPITQGLVCLIGNRLNRQKLAALFS